MHTRIHTLLASAMLLGLGAAPARGQNTTVDSRWLAYLGCWEPIRPSKSQLCVVPVAGTPDVELVTIVKGEVSTRERIVANGERRPTSHEGCTGWQTVEWSARGPRLYIRSGDSCPTVDNTGTGLIAMTGDGDQWLYIQGVTIGGQTGVHVERYREAASDLLLPQSVKDALRLDIATSARARAGAAAVLATDDVVEATPHLDTSVLEAWLVDRGDPFTLDAKRLIALADAGVPSRVIDLMVALSYPKVFVINGMSRQGERRPATTSAGGGYAGPDVGYAQRPYGRYDQCSMFYLLWGYSPLECAGYYPGYGFGPRIYGGGYPVQIVFVGGGNARHGRVVNGQGYKQGDDGGVTTGGVPRSGDMGAVTPSGYSGNSGSSGSSSSSSGSSDSGRTAHRRP